MRYDNNTIRPTEAEAMRDEATRRPVNQAQFEQAVAEMAANDPWRF